MKICKDIISIRPTHRQRRMYLSPKQITSVTLKNNLYTIGRKDVGIDMSIYKDSSQHFERFLEKCMHVNEGEWTPSQSGDRSSA